MGKASQIFAGTVIAHADFTPALPALTLAAPSSVAVTGEPSAALQFFASDTKVSSATPRRRRGKSMSRRRGQDGSIETSGKWIVVRFWVDVPGQEERRHACERICPKSGLGLLSKSEQKRRAKEIIAASGCDTEEHFRKVVLKKKVVTFREQAERWLDWLQTRNNKPIPETSVPTIRSAIDKWLNPNLGDLPLSEVGNGALKGVVKKMVGKLSPKTQRTYIGYAKQIRESLIDDEGEPIYPVTWNNDFIDLPPVVKREQRRGKVSAEDIEKLIADAENEWVHAVYVLSAAGGMRVAEVLAIDINTCLSPDCSLILVKQQVKGSKVVEYLKTEAAYRIVDLCPEAAEYLRKFVGDRKGLLFPSQKRTTPVSYGNFLKRYLTPSMKKLGIRERGKAAHAFRRFRSSIIAKSGVEEDIREFWLGHENRTDTRGQPVATGFGSESRTRIPVFGVRSKANCP
jgi:integrase